MNRRLKESNYDQLYAYLKQHEAHANENKKMLERYNQHAIDPLTLVSNVSPHQYPSQSSVTPPSTYVPPVNYPPQFADNTQLDSCFTPTDDLIENLTKTNVQSRRNRGQRNYTRGAPAAGNEGVQNRTMFMANLSSPDPIYDEADPSYDSDILSEVQDHDNYVDSIVKTHHAPAIVHDSEDTLEIAKTTRKKINEKMKDPTLVKKKVKIIPLEYSKENYLATFTPQKQLTFKKIFWSDDILKEKAKALKERANDPKQITAMTVKCDETERKNLLITNEYLIADFLSKEVFYTAMNYVLTISTFSELNKAYTVEQVRCLELEAEPSKLKDTIKKMIIMR
nr:hypothetical protein [Tanacetum cinerariifolium]